MCVHTRTYARAHTHTHTQSFLAQVVVKDAVLANSEWSGGALFELPETFHLSMADRGSFDFSVSPLTPLVRHPVFLGIVPADTDLNKVHGCSVCNAKVSLGQQ